MLPGIQLLMIASCSLLHWKLFRGEPQNRARETWIGSAHSQLRSEPVINWTELQCRSAVHSHAQKRYAEISVSPVSQSNANGI